MVTNVELWQWQCIGNYSG